MKKAHHGRAHEMKKAHPHHKAEMEHHRMRAEHKRAHNSEKKMEYAHHPAMVDNRMMHDRHQEGIERIKQRKGDMQVGQHGSMSGGWKHGMHTETHFGRGGETGMAPTKG